MLKRFFASFRCDKRLKKFRSYFLSNVIMMYYIKFREIIVERGWLQAVMILKHKFSELYFNHVSKHKCIKLRVKKVYRFFFRTKKTCSYKLVLENYQFL